MLVSLDRHFFVFLQSRTHIVEEPLQALLLLGKSGGLGGAS